MSAQQTRPGANGSGRKDCTNDTPHRVDSGFWIGRSPGDLKEERAKKGWPQSEPPPALDALPMLTSRSPTFPRALLRTVLGGLLESKFFGRILDRRRKIRLLDEGLKLEYDGQMQCPSFSGNGLAVELRYVSGGFWATEVMREWREQRNLERRNLARKGLDWRELLLESLREESCSFENGQSSVEDVAGLLNDAINPTALDGWESEEEDDVTIAPRPAYFKAFEAAVPTAVDDDRRLVPWPCD